MPSPKKMPWMYIESKSLEEWLSKLVVRFSKIEGIGRLARPRRREPVLRALSFSNQPPL
jgi:hypothetical protein